jgi:hypothetical protein
MDIAPISTNPAMAVAVRQMGTQTALQTAVIKQIAESQAQMAEILQALGVGQNLDLRA